MQMISCEFCQAFWINFSTGNLYKTTCVPQLLTCNLYREQLLLKSSFLKHHQQDFVASSKCLLLLSNLRKKFTTCNHVLFSIQFVKEGQRVEIESLNPGNSPSNVIQGHKHKFNSTTSLGAIQRTKIFTGLRPLHQTLLHFYPSMTKQRDILN